MLEETLNNTESAQKHYEESLAIKREIPKTPYYLDNLSTTLNNLATFEEKNCAIDSAKKHFQEALDIRKYLPQTPQYLNNLLILLGNIAPLEVTLGDTDSAKKHLKEGLEVSRQIGNEEFIGFFEKILSNFS